MPYVKDLYFVAAVAVENPVRQSTSKENANTLDVRRGTGIREIGQPGNDLPDGRLGTNSGLRTSFLGILVDGGEVGLRLRCLPILIVRGV